MIKYNNEKDETCSKMEQVQKEDGRMISRSVFES
jgi:hypothetical protein